MLVRRAFVREEKISDAERKEWPFTVPCVDGLIGRGLEFTSPITVLVGENGSGKSTVVEALAEAFGLDSHGGRAGRKYGNNRPKTPLGDVLEIELTAAGARMKRARRSKQKGFFLRAETAFGLMSVVSGMPGYWDEDTTILSHGEGFLTVFDSMFSSPGLYIMDEPEAPLSFTSCLRLIGLMHELAESGAQIIFATHSPLLASTPGADIVEVGEHGIRRVDWEDLDVVDHWRRYLNNPHAYLRHVVEPPTDQ
ncbi:AAA family ATPase [Phytoactinopolyspora mesophila]|uniref:AAA family ATPase n=1 Tax=Phytoactinopolyspora mesophila TaxID=2650750 RepID=A0A7K3MB52_9ACTN|nr:AAA family ATPase [Phytoactinopolyspora mesophila]